LLLLQLITFALLALGGRRVVGVDFLVLVPAVMFIMAYICVRKRTRQKVNKEHSRSESIPTRTVNTT
jgi:hypothetical protein